MSAKKTKFTPWFPGKVNPVRKGVYQRNVNYGGFQDFSYWTGKVWSVGALSVQHALEFKGRPTLRGSLPWRGLAQKP